MAKRFDIHEWQAKQRLAEQEDFTPDLEDDELKRSKIQQMMAKEKEPMGGDEKLRSAVEAIANMYSYGEILDAIESFYIKNDEQKSAEIARKHAQEFRAILDDEDELNENNKSFKEKITDFLTNEGVKYQISIAIGVLIAGLMRRPELIDKVLSFIGLKEGSCGYSVDGNINPEDTSSNTPGGLKSMTADKRTQMVKNIMEKMKSKKS